MSKEGSVEFEQELHFDIQVANIPRMARLCFAIYEMSKTAKGVKARKLKDSKQVSFFAFNEYVFPGEEISNIYVVVSGFIHESIGLG